MNQELFKKIRHVVSGRLLILRKKINKDSFKKWGAMLRGRLHNGKVNAEANLGKLIRWTKERLRTLCGWLQQSLSREALRDYARKVSVWAKQHLNREALRSYCRTALCRLQELRKKLTWENIKAWALALWAWLCDLPNTLQELRKNALLMSCALLVLWLLMGTTTTLAWFTDTTPTARNTFAVGKMDLQVAYKNDKTPDYTPMNDDSKVFLDEALYEPGYTQVVYLRITNAGDMDFDYRITVRDFLSVDSTNVYGKPLHLPEYLRFGLVTAAAEPELDRALARQIADQEMEEYCLGEYSETNYQLKAGEEAYAALVVYMPEHVGNDANYRGETVPQVTLGITVYAQQAGTIDLE